jgi:predicted outer membrane lipoprotein
LSILHLPLSLACPFLIYLCLWFVHSSFTFVSGLSILHLPLSLTCPFFICLCLWLVHSSFSKANEEWTS